MSISQKQKEAVDFAIRQNPTTVVVTRVEYQEQDGARKKVTTTLRPQTILLYPSSSGRSRKGSGEDASPKADASKWGALAPSDADVRWGAFVEDSFTVEGLGTFEVESGRPLVIGSDVNGYQLVLKKVS